MAFIIGNYNRFDRWDREHSVYVFEINGQKYAVKKVEMEWGLPQVRERIGEETRPDQYYIYDTYEDAMKFVRQMKMINAR